MWRRTEWAGQMPGQWRRPGERQMDNRYQIVRCLDSRRELDWTREELAVEEAHLDFYFEWKQGRISTYLLFVDMRSDDDDRQNKLISDSERIKITGDFNSRLAYFSCLFSSPSPFFLYFAKQKGGRIHSNSTWTCTRALTLTHSLTLSLIYFWGLFNFCHSSPRASGETKCFVLPVFISGPSQERFALTQITGECEGQFNRSKNCIHKRQTGWAAFSERL